MHTVSEVGIRSCAARGIYFRTVAFVFGGLDRSNSGIREQTQEAKVYSP